VFGVGRVEFIDVEDLGSHGGVLLVFWYEDVTMIAQSLWHVGSDLQTERC
jgi:hypothetical protein